MTEISDEMLMAYCDGELEPRDAARVEAYLATGAAAQARLTAFQVTGRDTLAGLFERAISEPMPQRLIKAITSASPADDSLKQPASVSSGNVIPFARGAKAVEPRRAFQSSSLWPMAAALAVALAAAGTVLSQRWNSPSITAPDVFATITTPAGQRSAAPALAQVLESTPSGQAVSANVGGVPVSIKPAFSFASMSGGFCRQYAMTRDGGGMAGVACRQADGGWRVEAQFAAKADAASGDNVKPAGVEGTEGIDRIVDGLISGDVLGADAETRIMRGGWARP